MRKALAIFIACTALTGCMKLLVVPITSLSDPQFKSIDLVAGTKFPNAGSVDGSASIALFNAPGDIATDGLNLYIVDSGSNLIRKIDGSTGEVVTLAGWSGRGDSVDGLGPLAGFAYPTALTYANSFLYVLDGSTNVIRQVSVLTGATTTIAGLAGASGLTDGVGASARFNFGYSGGVTSDGTNLYVMDNSNNKIRKVVIATGQVTTLAPVDAVSNPVSFYFNSRAGGIHYESGVLYVVENGAMRLSSINLTSLLNTTIQSGFNFPSDVTSDGTYLYLAQLGNRNVNRDSVIFRVKISDGTMTTFAGKRSTFGFANGTGGSARFNYPIGLTYLNGALYVADQNNNVIRRVQTADASVTTFAGRDVALLPDGSTDGIGTAARFFLPTGLASDGTSLFIADSGNETIRKVDIATKVSITLAGTVGTPGNVDATGSAARFSFGGNQVQIVRMAGDLYLTDYGNNVIRKLVISTGQVTTVAGSSGYGQSGLATDGTSLFVPFARQIVKINVGTGTTSVLAGTGVSGNTDGVAGVATFSNPAYLAADAANVYVSDGSALIIRKVVIATGDVTTIAGAAGVSQHYNGPALTTARFRQPMALVYLNGSLYIIDYWSAAIRKLDLTTQIVSTETAFRYNEMGWAGVAIASDGTDLFYTYSMSQTVVRYSFQNGYHRFSRVGRKRCGLSTEATDQKIIRR